MIAISIIVNVIIFVTITINAVKVITIQTMIMNFSFLSWICWILANLADKLAVDGHALEVSRVGK